MQAAPAWDVFCRVIDNHGDIGVAWRLCADLAARGLRVRLWVDDGKALEWMAPHGAAGLEIVAWADPPPDLAPGDVVVETFGCDLPQRFVQRMAASAPAPVWINLEYLSAEAYVERSHGLSSPVKVASDRWLARHFFYPGFTERTGGLVRESALSAAAQLFDRSVWLSNIGVDAVPGERLVSLFCYDNPALASLPDLLGDSPTHLLVTPGAPAVQIGALLGPSLRRGALRASLLPYLTQPGYDRLLWSCDLNFVRGEDSFVRAQWAGKPFVWQLYPQRDDAHRAKLHAFLDRMLAGCDPGLGSAICRLWLAWNGFGALPAALPAPAPWSELCQAWRDRLVAQSDLTCRLLEFVRRTR